MSESHSGSPTLVPPVTVGQMDEQELQNLLQVAGKFRQANDPILKTLNTEQENAVNEILSLEERRKNGEVLSSLDEEYLKNLKTFLKEGGKQVEYVHTLDLLRQRIGPEKFARYKLNLAAHEKERDLLRSMNDELQRQLELAKGHVAKPTFNTMDNGKLSYPGTYLVDVGDDGRVTDAYLVEYRPKPSLWQRFLTFFRAGK